MDVAAFGAAAASAPLEPMRITRRDVGPRDVLIAIEYSGICHSDIHQAREEWFASIFPMVPGHEIAGTVQEIGAEVSDLAVGDKVGIGCYVDSCRTCVNCKRGLQNYCLGHTAFTYNGYEMDQQTPTYGGYSTHIVADRDYVLRIPGALGLDVAAPLMCAGITSYQPLAEWGAGPGKHVGVVGLGGLGHMAVKLAHAMGAHVTMISHSPGKAEDAARLGADAFLLSSDKAAMKAAASSMDLIVNSASAVTELDPYMRLLMTDGTMVMTGLPESAMSINAFSLTMQRRRLAGINNGGIPQTQEMLDFCGLHGIGSDVEVIGAGEINHAWDRVVASDVRYRFVIDTSTLGA